jgi:SNF2 family DNA or RNA helicase
VKLFKNKYLLIPGKSKHKIGKTILFKGKPLTALPWNHRTYLLCKGLGYKKLPSPLATYNFKRSPYRPYKHQKVTSEFLVQHFKCFCWNEAGTGKTASCLWAFDFLRQQKMLKKLLVICPLSTTQNVWGNELFKMMVTVKHGILTGVKSKRLQQLEHNYDIYIINHDGIKILLDELLEWQPDLIIVDEHTAFKNQRTDRFKALVKLSKKAKAMWMLSGTPAPQAPTDVFAPARLICPEKVGRSFVRFRDRTMCQVSMYRWLPRPNFEDILCECVQPVIRFSREECLDLPDVTTQTFEVGMSTKQRDTFNKLRRDAILQIDGGMITAVNEGVMRNKLLQCCSGYVYDENKDVINLNPKERLETLKELIDETSRGVLVFMHFRSSVAATEKYLSKYYEVKTVTGETSLKKRNQYFNDFQDGKIKVLVLHPRTAGHGLTLTEADTVIWYLVTSDNELYQQANSRIQRIGQNCKMRVIHLISTKLERQILIRLEEKRSMQGLLLEVLGKK